MKFRSIVALGALVGSLTFAPGVLSSAIAINAASTSNAISTSFSTATFLLAPVLISTDSNVGSPLSVALNTGATRGQLFYLKNFGTLGVNQFTLSQTFTTGPTGVAISYCPTSPFTFKSTSACTTGTPTTILSGASGSSALVTLSVASGATRQLSMRQVSNNATTETLSVSVARSGVRVGVVTNS